MARYPLAAKLEEFHDILNKMVGSQGWQGRLTTWWHHRRDEFTTGEFKKTDGSQKQYIIKHRKVAKAWVDEDESRAGLEDVLMEIITFPEGLLERLNKAYKESVNDRSRDLIIVPEPMALIDLYKSWLDSREIRFQALGVMGLTGRRFNEVLSQGTFEPVYQETERGRVYSRYVLEFGGQAKTRGAEGTMHGQTYRIPVLCDSRKILSAIERIRNAEDGQLWAAMNYEKLNSSESLKMNMMLKSVLANKAYVTDEMREIMTIKSMRALYAEIAFEHMAPRTYTKNAYFSSILGHAEDDLQTSLSYMIFTLGSSESKHRAARGIVSRLISELERREQEREAIAAAGPGRDFEVIDEKDK